MSTKICSKCGVEKDATLFHVDKSKSDNRNPWCKRCNAIRKREQARSRRRAILALAGDACCRCGYSEFPAALDFHHVSDDKEHTVSRLAHQGKWGDVVAEAEKCILLCANCHRGLHSGEWELERLSSGE